MIGSGQYEGQTWTVVLCKLLEINIDRYEGDAFCVDEIYQYIRISR